MREPLRAKALYAQTRPPNPVGGGSVAEKSPQPHRRQRPRQGFKPIYRPADRFAARTVFAIRMAMVIRPTPPGTGVIAPATAAASALAAPRTRRVPGLRDVWRSTEVTRLMPTSITIAPGLTQSPRAISGWPT